MCPTWEKRLGTNHSGILENQMSRSWEVGVAGYLWVMSQDKHSKMLSPSNLTIFKVALFCSAIQISWNGINKRQLISRLDHLFNSRLQLASYYSFAITNFRLYVIWLRHLYNITQFNWNVLNGQKLLVWLKRNNHVCFFCSVLLHADHKAVQNELI